MSPNSECQALMPGLPDDLAILCLAKLSHGYHGLLECVSKKWRNVVRSSDFGNVKLRERWSGDWLFVLTDNQVNNQWIAYDPEADRWHSLPRIPSITHAYHHYGFSYVTVNNKFLVLGGCFYPNNPYSCPRTSYWPTNDVMQFDPCKKQWSRLASMQTKRSDFACALVSGKVYVAGGWNSNFEELDTAEVYDPLWDRWDDLPRLPAPQRDCFGILHDGRFLVFRKNAAGDVPNNCHNFEPSDNSWHPTSFFSSITLMNVITAEPGDCCYTVNIAGGNIVYAKNKAEEDWIPLVKVPPVFLRNHSRPLESFSFGFVTLGKDLYVVGGKVLKWDESSKAYHIVQLDLVRVCDVTLSPLQWRETRPMHGNCGAVIACGSLKE